MDDLNNINRETEEINGEEIIGEEELSHSDKMVGVFSEPKTTFGSMAKFPPRTKDWLIPILILFALLSLTRILLMMNEEIYYEIKQQQTSAVEERFRDAVESGQMTEEEANQQMDRVQDQMEMGRGPVGMILQTVSIFIGGFIFFFIITGIYYLIIKFGFKDEGTFSSALVANGMTAYITMIQVIIATIASFALSTMIQDTSVASFVDVEKGTFLKWVLAKVDPVAIWSYVILTIGFAKMFHSKSMGKYYGLVFGLWIIGSLILWWIAQAVPFLGFLAG